MEARKQKVKKENKPMVVPLTSDYYHKIDRILGNLGKIPNKRLQCGLFGVFYAEYLSFTMAIYRVAPRVSPRYPSHYLYSIHTCACDLCA